VCLKEVHELVLNKVNNMTVLFVCHAPRDIRKTTASEYSRALPACLSDNSNIEMKMSTEH
jgi:hypothetical protein